MTDLLYMANFSVNGVGIDSVRFNIYPEDDASRCELHGPARYRALLERMLSIHGGTEMPRDGTSDEQPVRVVFEAYVPFDVRKAVDIYRGVLETCVKPGTKLSPTRYEYAGTRDDMLYIVFREHDGSKPFEVYVIVSGPDDVISNWHRLALQSDTVDKIMPADRHGEFIVSLHKNANWLNARLSIYHELATIFNELVKPLRP